MGYHATALCLLLACFGGGQSMARRLRTEAMPSEDRFNFFDLEFIQSIAQAQEGNVVVSPVSVKATLAMLLEGAGGETATQIRTALRLPEHQAKVQAVIHAYLEDLKVQDQGYKLDLENRVFMSNSLSPSTSYRNVLQTMYYADVETVDFNYQERTAQKINSWVKGVTRGLIPRLVEPGSLQPDSQVLIANAVYFKGKWKIPFDSTGTSARCFYSQPGQCRQANMMETLAYYNYAYLSALDAYALELPYEGDKYSMVVVMPKEQDGMTQLLRDIAHERMQNIIGALVATEVLVSLPRFDIEFASDLVPTLSGLGVTDLFSPQSNLTGLFRGTETSAQVSNVFHKAKIIVNEEGSEAGAGTGALVIPLMGGSVIPKFRVDRPFMFFIREMTNGVIVFAGRVTEPEAVQSDAVFEAVFPSTAEPFSTTRRKNSGNRPRKTTTTERPPWTHNEGTATKPSYVATPEPSPTRKPSYAEAVYPQSQSNQQNSPSRPLPDTSSYQGSNYNSNQGTNYNSQSSQASNANNQQSQNTQSHKVSQTVRPYPNSDALNLAQPQNTPKTPVVALSLEGYNSNANGYTPSQSVYNKNQPNYNSPNTYNTVREQEYLYVQNTNHRGQDTKTQYVDRNTQPTNTVVRDQQYGNPQNPNRQHSNVNTLDNPNRQDPYPNTQQANRGSTNPVKPDSAYQTRPELLSPSQHHTPDRRENTQPLAYQPPRQVNPQFPQPTYPYALSPDVRTPVQGNKFVPTNSEPTINAQSFQGNGQQQYAAAEETRRRNTNVGYSQPNTDAIHFSNNQGQEGRY